MMHLPDKTAKEPVEILIVEDSPTQAERLRYILEQHGHRVFLARNGKEALAMIHDHRPTLVISDIVMPEMDGYELCRTIKAAPALRELPVVLVTSLADPHDAIKGLECGANSFVPKPYDESYLLSLLEQILTPPDLSREVGGQGGLQVNFAGQTYAIAANREQILKFLLCSYEIAVGKNRELMQAQNELRRFNEELERQVQERTASLRQEVAQRQLAQEELEASLGRLERTLNGTVLALTTVIESRDPYTSGHQKRVSLLACAIAREMGLPGNQIAGIQIAGILHDIGKIHVPSEILTRPSRLSDIEFAMIKTHPEIGYEIMKSIENPWSVADMILQHHEKLNGSGYPGGLKDNDILLEARILCVADVVEAMASHRPYRASLGIEKALEEIVQNRGLYYDPTVVDACIKVFKEGKFTF
jgi:putative nucleotidyltransferase with HDIG domain